MRDGFTRKLEKHEPESPSFEQFRRRWRASLVILSGGPEGSEYELDRPQLTLGRGPEVDVAFDDQTMSRQHAAFEFVGQGFRVRDLGSMNGLLVNDREVRVTELTGGDRVQIGHLVLQLVLEKCEGPPKTYVIPEE